MTLSRSKPLRADRTHSWEMVADMGAYRKFRCSRCHSHRRVRLRADLPEKWCNGLKRSELERTSGLSPVSKSNSDHPNDDESYRGWVKELPCVVCGSPPPNDPHHLRSKGAGHGDFLDDGSGNLLPMCREHHREFHDQGRETFADEHGISLAHEARRFGERWRGRG